MVQIDIQMPSDCYSCWVRKNMGCKIANDSGWLNNKRDDNCPLKEQEPRVMTLSEIEQSEGRIVWFEDDQFNNYALVDGIDQRNGWVWLSHMGLQQRRDYENYGKRWRCWTKRPEEDQRKAVKLSEF